MLIMEITSLELIAGHIGNMLIIEMAKIEINRRPYWIYANHRDGQQKLTAGHIGFMLIIEMIKIEINRRPYWTYANYRDGQNRNYPAAILNLS